ncbi:Hch1p [Ascoidea rubescens DSM 1968]|uniref:Activator of Hsp90 ATPase n=1 Tax=Ascoidea rubescens DSM 1968 TaxID=1344418 RepID=A0A1D2VB56_9ASCO|nr:activator of Hsp90 ATPase [Ascoidea rubescens DSM 1968]ODV58839.1 activator of Hsp90 ATPase [Ascoidea rubescens DSM 1968]
MVVNNPNNWHWVDKNCLNWAKEYLENNLTTISKAVSVAKNKKDSGDNSEILIKVVKINSVSGDCDVAQRKGKTKCIFDLNLEFEVNGVLLNTKDDAIEGKGETPAGKDAEKEGKESSEKSSEKSNANVLFSNKVSLPEFLHDMPQADYNFIIHSSTINSDEPLDMNEKSVIRANLLPLVTAELMKFQSVLIDTHSKDIQHSF